MSHKGHGTYRTHNATGTKAKAKATGAVMMNLSRTRKIAEPTALSLHADMKRNRCCDECGPAAASCRRDCRLLDLHTTAVTAAPARSFMRLCLKGTWGRIRKPAQGVCWGPGLGGVWMRVQSR